MTARPKVEVAREHLSKAQEEAAAGDLRDAVQWGFASLEAAIDALAAPHQRTALAYGLSERVRLARAFRAALLPLVSYLGPAAAAVMPRPIEAGVLGIERTTAVPLGSRRSKPSMRRPAATDSNR